MQVIISTRGLPVSATYRDAVTRRLEKLERLWPRIIDAKIVLSGEKSRRRAALTISGRQRTFRSEATAGDLATAVGLAVEALERQVREAKDRAKHHKGRRARVRRPVGEPVGPGGPDVAVRRIALKPMSLGEAVEQLGRVGETFVVFRPAGADGLGILYRRKDGGLGLIEPVA